MTNAAPPGTYRSALRVREFDAIAGASLISILGDGAAFLAATVLVYQRTGSALLSSLTFTVAFVPYLFGGTLLAGLADRLAPKALLVGFDLAGAALIAMTTIPGVPLVALFAALFVLGAVAPVRSGTAGALVSEILPGDTFVAGRSVLRISGQVGQIAGTGLGGLLVAALGPRGALPADTVSFLLSAALGAALIQRRPARGRTRSQSLVADSLSGIREVWSHPTLRRLLLLTWISAFVAVAPEGLAAPAVAQTGHPASYVGFWLGAIPVGTVLGDLLAVWFVPPGRRHRLIWPLALTLPAPLILFVIGPPFVASIVLLSATGAASAYGLGLDQSLRNTTPPALLARMFTLNGTGLMVAQGLGFAAAGATAQLLPAHDTIAVAGGLGVLAVLILARATRRASVRSVRATTRSASAAAFGRSPTG